MELTVGKLCFNIIFLKGFVFDQMFYVITVTILCEVSSLSFDDIKL